MNEYEIEALRNVLIYLTDERRHYDALEGDDMAQATHIYGDISILEDYYEKVSGELSPISDYIV